jgi:hypothetical protein
LGILSKLSPQGCFTNLPYGGILIMGFLVISKGKQHFPCLWHSAKKTTILHQFIAMTY